MKKLLLIFGLLLFFAADANATLTFIQKKSNDACAAGTSCVVSGLSAIGTGRLLIGIAWFSNASGQAAAGVSGAGTWVHSTSPSCSGANGSFASDSVYILSTSAAAPTSITIFLAATATGWHAEVREYSFTAGPLTFDTCAGASDATCTSCLGVGLTLTGANHVVVQYVNPAATCSAINLSYGNLNTNGAGGVCSADLLNTTSGAQPTWTTASGTSMVGGIAIAEAATIPPQRSLMGVGL